MIPTVGQENSWFNSREEEVGCWGKNTEWEAPTSGLRVN